MDVFFISKRHSLTKKDMQKHIFFYKSEKSHGSVSDFLISDSWSAESPPLLKILSPNTFISLKILSGEENFETSSPNNPAIFGNTNIDKTITHNPITAYLIELIAGLILSSFPPERMSNTPPQRIYIIEKIPANNTIIAIANNMKSPKSIWELNKVEFEETFVAEIA